jgi:Mg2+ and Co2+ transporter CorA
MTTPTLIEKLVDEQHARLFHDTYERLAPSFGYETRNDTKQFDPTTPNGKLMIAVCKEVALTIQKAERDAVREIVKKVELKVLRGYSDFEIREDVIAFYKDAVEATKQAIFHHLDEQDKTNEI